MNKSISARIAALTDAVQRRQMEQDMPVDSLSESLYELGAELAALDDLGVLLEAQELGIGPDDVRNMAQSLVRPIGY